MVVAINFASRHRWDPGSHGPAQRGAVVRNLSGGGTDGALENNAGEAPIPRLMRSRVPRQPLRILFADSSCSGLDHVVLSKTRGCGGTLILTNDAPSRLPVR